MSSLYNVIKTCWFIRDGYNLECPPHIQPVEDQARKYDEILSNKFNEPIEQYRNGLISSVELLDKLFYEAHKEYNSPSDMEK